MRELIEEELAAMEEAEEARGEALSRQYKRLYCFGTSTVDWR